MARAKEREKAKEKEKAKGEKVLQPLVLSSPKLSRRLKARDSPHAMTFGSVTVWDL